VVKHLLRHLMLMLLQTPPCFWQLLLTERRAANAAEQADLSAVLCCVSSHTSHHHSWHCAVVKSQLAGQLLAQLHEALPNMMLLTASSCCCYCCASDDAQQMYRIGYASPRDRISAAWWIYSITHLLLRPQALPGPSCECRSLHGNAAGCSLQAPMKMPETAV
jgi:hypothetical protein